MSYSNSQQSTLPGQNNSSTSTSDFDPFFSDEGRGNADTNGWYETSAGLMPLHTGDDMPDNVTNPSLQNKGNDIAQTGGAGRHSSVGVSNLPGDTNGKYPSNPSGIRNAVRPFGRRLPGGDSDNIPDWTVKYPDTGFGKNATVPAAASSAGYDAAGNRSPTAMRNGKPAGASPSGSPQTTPPSPAPSGSTADAQGQSTPRTPGGLLIIHRDSGQDSPGTMYIFENGRYAGSARVNENGYMVKGEHGLSQDSHGVPASQTGTEYRILPKNNYKEGDAYLAGQPSVTAPQYANPHSPNYAPGRAGPGYKKDGTVRAHNKSVNGSHDSTACWTMSPEKVSQVTGIMNRNMNNGGTTGIVYTTPQTIKGPDGQEHEVRQAEPVLR